VELVGQVAELAKKVLPREFRWIDTAKEVRVILVEAGPAVLGAFDPKLQAYALRHLQKLGVDVRVDSMATDMDADSITVKETGDEQRIDTKTKIWAAGVQASPLAKLLADATGADTDRAGRVAVLPDCTLPDHPEVFAIGDMVSLTDLPGVAQPAIQEGKYVGKVIRARLEGDAEVPPSRTSTRAAWPPLATTPPSRTRSGCGSPVSSDTSCGGSSTCCT
jgi:NADH:ubiquinone reductase (H+-translocating)